MGLFLASPDADPCEYVECLYENDPWPDENGNIPLMSVTRRCAPGTATADDYIGGLHNPCGARSVACGGVSEYNLL